MVVARGGEQAQVDAAGMSGGGGGAGICLLDFLLSLVLASTLCRELQGGKQARRRHTWTEEAGTLGPRVHEIEIGMIFILEGHGQQDGVGRQHRARRLGLIEKRMRPARVFEERDARIEPVEVG